MVVQFWYCEWDEADYIHIREKNDKDDHVFLVDNQIEDFKNSFKAPFTIKKIGDRGENEVMLSKLGEKSYVLWVGDETEGLEEAICKVQMDFTGKEIQAKVKKALKKKKLLERKAAEKNKKAEKRKIENTEEGETSDKEEQQQGTSKKVKKEKLEKKGSKKGDKKGGKK